MKRKVLTLTHPSIQDALKGVETARNKSMWKAFKDAFKKSWHARDFTAANGPINAVLKVRVGAKVAVGHVGKVIAYEAFRDKALLTQLKDLKKEGWTHITVDKKGQPILEKLSMPTDYMFSGPNTMHANLHHIPISNILAWAEDFKGSKIRDGLAAAGTPIGFKKP
ncbi:MAG: hypothetical protein WCW44_01020 [archaeon]|jgi:hypothetical protein